jgi:hypothetical protein
MIARYIKLNDGGLQSCLNTMFTQDCKKKNAYIVIWSINIGIKAFIIKLHKKSQANIRWMMTKRWMQNANAKSWHKQTLARLEKHFWCGLQYAKDKAWSHTSSKVSIVNKEVTHRKQSINQTNKG